MIRPTRHRSFRTLSRNLKVATVAALLCLAIVSWRPARGQSSAPAVALASASAPSSSANQSTQQPVLQATPDGRPLQIDIGAAGLWQSLLQLHTRASMLMVVAHPDDEDGGMLAYESRGQGARTMLMTLNRGEGGQNSMADDYYDALGLERTQELLAADRYYGVEQFWSSVVDFGFSKSLEEAMTMWGHDRVLADVVRVVRMTRPLVITSVFVGGPSDGHGHHAVSGEMAQEVFNAAGDPNMFPEQIAAGLKPWSPLKMYARVPTFSVSDKGMLDSATGKYLPVRFYDFIAKKWSDGTPSVNVKIPEGTFDPVLGATYQQIAREGWSLQKSQNGGGNIPYAAPQEAPYHRYGSLVPAKDTEKSFYDGVDISLMGIADLAKGQPNAFLKSGLAGINAQVERASSEFSAAHPEKIAPALAVGLKQTNALAGQVAKSNLSPQAKYDVGHELAIKQAQFQKALVQSLGVTLDAGIGPKKEPTRNNGGPGNNNGPTESFANAVPGQEFIVKVHLDNPGSTPLTLHRLWLETPTGETWTVTPEAAAPSTVAANQALDQRIQVRVPDNAAPTRPYFTRPNDEQAYYDIQDDTYRNLSGKPYPLSAWAEISYGGVTARIGQVVQTAVQETGSGLVLNPLTVTPALSVRISPEAGITPLDSKSFSLSALVHTEAPSGAKGTVHLELPAGWRSDPPTAQFALARAGEEQSVAFQVFPNSLEQKPYAITAVADSAGKQYREGFTTVGYTGLRPSHLYRPSTYRTSGVDIKVAPGLRVAYITGTGDDVPDSLKNIGINVEFLSPQDLAQGDLSKYDVILLGVRTYTARPELATNNQRLLNYVQNGGVVVVQYNSVQYDHNFGPYPYSVPNDAERVVDETSPVQFLLPNDPVLNWPNKIGPNDFTGWAEERGHNFMKTWDDHYIAPIETHDPEQDPQKGGLIYAPYGRGVYVYVAFALYRQLPDGVPGAYRLLANLLSLPRNPAFKQALPPVSAIRGTPGQ
jgi:LmbE family N-acetylglucosaminyl deacetylase